MLGRLTGGFIALLMTISMYSPIKHEISLADTSSFSSYKIIAFNLVPLFFLITGCLMGIMIIFGGLRDALVFGVSEDYREDYEDEKDEPNHKQSYEEYVIEQLRVERIMRWGFLGRIF